MLAIAFAAALCLSAIAVSSAQAAKNPVVGAVYTESNDTSDNKVTVFDRKKNGKLKKREAVSTGGVGSTQSVGCGPGCPILDSQYAVVDNELNQVFAVNAGSDTVTSFVDGKKGLKRKSQVSSGGDMPESLALNPAGDVLYVLNVNTANSNGTTGNIYGLKVDEKGKLSPISGSSQPLASPSPPEGTPGGAATARGITFDPKGKTLVVTELAAGMGAGSIITFKVAGNGVAQPGVVNPSARPFPFGAGFTPDGTLVVPTIESPTGTAPGTVSTYNLNTGNGSVSLIETEQTNGVLPCWVASTASGYVYIVNTGAGMPASVARFNLADDGGLAFQGLTTSTDDFAETDADTTEDDKYLYVLAPQVGPGPPSHIDGYKIKSNGGLKSIGSTPAGADLGIGATGLAAI